MQLWELALRMAERSKNSGNPVIVMGDFNIGGPPSKYGNKGYEDILSVLKGPEDLWMRTHPLQMGFTYDCLANHINKKNGCAYRERIDFIFLVTHPDLTNSPYLIKIPKSNDVKVVQWKANDIEQIRNLPVSSETYKTNVSDHFGLEATIEIREK